MTRTRMHDDEVDTDTDLVSRLLATQFPPGRVEPSDLAELAVDDASRLRGRGWALAQAVVALPYYWETNQGIVSQARHALDEIVTSG